MNWTPIAISLGAVFGALSRYYLSLYWLQRQGDRFPYGTLFVNLTGAFVIGLVSAGATVLGLTAAWQRFLLVGFLGAYTTFSTYVLDTVRLYRGQQRLQAIAYGFGSALLGLAFVELGLWVGHFLGERSPLA